MSFTPIVKNAAYVVGPASATDSAIARFDGTTGKLVQNSSLLLYDNKELALSENFTTYRQLIPVPISPAVVDVTLNTAHGTTLNTGFRYKVTAVTTGTSGDTGTTAIIWYNEPAATWNVRYVARETNATQHPQFTISGSTLQIFQSGTTQTYTMNVIVESFYVYESDATIHTFGVDSMWQRTNNDLSYSDGIIYIDTPSGTNKSVLSFYDLDVAKNSSNIEFALARRSDNYSAWIFGYDGSTFKNFIEFNYPNYVVQFPADGNTLYVDIANSRVGIGTSAPDTILDVAGAITQRPLSADPADPDAGNSVTWVSDGTGSGDAGDVMMKINVGGVTKTITLIDYSAAT